MKRTACLVRYDMQHNGRNVGKPSYGYARLAMHDGELMLKPSKWVKMEGYTGIVTGAIATIVAPVKHRGIVARIGIYAPLVVEEPDFVQINPTDWSTQ